MRIEALLLIGVAIFFGIIGICYWFIQPQWADAGLLMLIGTVLLGLLPGSYYLWWSARMKPRPEDRSDATIADGAGVIGSFPNSSIWPFVLGSGLFLVGMSAVFGLWLIAPGFALVISAGIGATVESRRGGNV
jgi:Cytochrome c oxidase subunit IV